MPAEARKTGEKIQDLESNGIRYFLFMHHPRFLKHVDFDELAPKRAIKSNAQNLNQLFIVQLLKAFEILNGL